MKLLTKSAFLLFVFFASLTANAQHIKINDGNLSAIKNEKTINIEFT